MNREKYHQKKEALSPKERYGDYLRCLEILEEEWTKAEGHKSILMELANVPMDSNDGYAVRQAGIQLISDVAYIGKRIWAILFALQRVDGQPMPRPPESRAHRSWTVARQKWEKRMTEKQAKEKANEPEEAY